MTKTLLLTIFTLHCFFVVFAQDKDTKNVPYFEKYILAGNKPPASEAQTQYDNDYKVIVWDEPLIKDYKYSNEAFDLIGYSFVKSNAGDNSQHSKVYRCCQKGIVVEVTEWYGMKLSIAMKWFSENVRNQIGDLTYCYSKPMSHEEESKMMAKIISDEHQREALKKEEDAKQMEILNNSLSPNPPYEIRFTKKKNKIIIDSYATEIVDEMVKMVLEKAKSPELKLNTTYYFQYTLYDNSSHTKFAVGNIGEVKKVKGMYHTGHMLEVPITESK